MLPKFFEKLPKKYPQQLLLKSDVFKIAQKVTKNLNYFCIKICCQENTIIAQSDHAELDFPDEPWLVQRDLRPLQRPRPRQVGRQVLVRRLRHVHGRVQANIQERPDWKVKMFNFCFLMWASPGLFLFMFVLFPKQRRIKHKPDDKWKSVNGVLGIWTRAGRFIGIGEPTQLCRQSVIFV